MPIAPSKLGRLSCQAMRTCKSTFVSTDGQYEVVIPESILEQMKFQCEQFSPVETGGVILGSYSNDGRVAEVQSITDAPSDSRHTRSSFIRGTADLKELLIRKWKTNEYYLGEWHTHPHGLPKPSPKDIRQMRNISRDARYQCAAPILVISCNHSHSKSAVGVHIINSDLILCART